jgi:uncharacterized membrane protein
MWWNPELVSGINVMANFSTTFKCSIFILVAAFVLLLVASLYERFRKRAKQKHKP